MKTKKTIIYLWIVFVIDAILTLMSFILKWDNLFSYAFLFSSIMILHSNFVSLVNLDNPKYDEIRRDSKNEHDKMREDSKKEHDEIKGIISLYKDLQLENAIINFEGRYAEEHKGNGVEIWVISNSVDENKEIINEIYKNLVLGVQYYYIIPKNDNGRCERDLKKAFEKIKNLNRKSHRNFEIKYIKDDLFDFMPTDFVDILFYCNPNETDYFANGYKDNMRVFYSLQCSKDDIYYKPVDLDLPTKHQFFDKMEDWKNHKAWQTLTC